MSHPRGSHRIFIYDPGHFTPYYNAGLCGQFAARGLNCTLVTLPAAFEVVDPAGYQVSYLFFRFLLGPIGSALRHRPRLRLLLKAISFPAGVWRTYRALKREAPGVFHIHTAVSPVLEAILARALRRRGWHIVYTLQVPQPKSAWDRWQYARLMEACDVVAMHDEGLAGRLRDLFPHLAGRIAPLTHGIDLPELPHEREREKMRSSLGVASGEVLLLCFGMLKPYKGVEDVLDALPAVLARVANVRLCIAGEPLMDMRGVMEKIAALPAGVVIQKLEFVPQSQVSRYFAAADLVLACYREIPASSVLLQAQAHARPVLATRVGALPAMLEEGRCGFLAGENLAQSIVETLADRERLVEIGRRGRARVERLHSWERVAEETLKLYPVRAEASNVPTR